jgi:hypothetical protein
MMGPAESRRNCFNEAAASMPRMTRLQGNIDDARSLARRLLVAGHAADYKVGDRQVGRARTRYPARAAIIGTLDCDWELVFPVTKPVAGRTAVGPSQYRYRASA